MEWKTVKLGEVCDLIAGFAFKAGDFGNYPSKVVKIKDIAPSMDNTGLDGVDMSKYNSSKLDKFVLQRGDFVAAMTGSLGKIGRYLGAEKVYINQRVLKFVPKDSVDWNFIYYSISTWEFYQYVLNHIDSQSVQPNISATTIGKYEFPLPPLETQRRIAAILSSLDDKIENNNRINRNLEAQAQALFKSWFVDFEPWGGIMPEDWKEGTLGEIAEFKRGKGILGKEARPGNVPVVAGGMEPAYYHDTANTKAPVITISASGANAGYVRLYNEDIWASDCSWIDASSKNLLWVYCYLSINRHILRHAQTGAVQPHVKAKDVNAFEIIVPAQKVIEDFIEVVKPLFEQIANNQRESARLATLRDTLLPKLMRGEIAL